MKLLPDTQQGSSITGYGNGWVAVNGVKFHESVIVSPQSPTVAWGCPEFDALAPRHFAPFAEAGIELLIFGSGSRLRFPTPLLLQALYAQRIGVETMDTPAACRTFNFLANEGRRVAAALLL